MNFIVDREPFETGSFRLVIDDFPAALYRDLVECNYCVSIIFFSLEVRLSYACCFSCHLLVHPCVSSHF